MVLYRTFRNTDPPGLTEVWNEAFTGRGAVLLRNSAALERFVYASPLFDPAGLFVAEEEDHTIVGFAHAGFCRSASDGQVDSRQGVLCMIAVRPRLQRRGLGSRLLELGEDYLRRHGAQKFWAGPHHPHNPFYLGLYGGCELPGFLVSDPLAQPFLNKHSYQVERRTVVLQRLLDASLRFIDPRFANLRRRFELSVSSPRKLGGYWDECVLGSTEILELRLEDKESGQIAAHSHVWEMEGFSCRWNHPAIGILNFEVGDKWRRQGLGKYLLSLLIRHMQDQFFEIAEVQLDENNVPALRFLKSLRFEQVDTGQVFLKVTNAGNV